MSKTRNRFNVCSRIQGLAEPNTVAMSATIYHLVQGYFDCEALGAQTLRGVTEPLHVYRVLQESGARGRLDVAVTRGGSVAKLLFREFGSL